MGIAQTRRGTRTLRVPTPVLALDTRECKGQTAARTSWPGVAATMSAMSETPPTDRPAHLMVRVRNFANWCNLSTPFGLAVAALGRARLTRAADGLFLAEGYRLAFPMAGAFTVGSVVITGHRSWSQMEALHPGTLEHEVNHTWQWAYMMGLPFLPVYTACMCWSWLRTGDRASANFFERSADLALGGYFEAEKRPLRQGFAALRTAAGLGRTRSRD